MPEIVDELVMTLGLDARPYKAGSAEAEANIGRLQQTADKAAKDMEVSGKRGAEFFSQIKTEALSLIGVLAGTAGIGMAIRNATDDMAALGRTAQNLNLPVQTFQAWRNVMQEHGASAESLTGSLSGIQMYLERIKTLGGGQDLAGYLGLIGAAQSDSPLAVLQKFMRFVEENPGNPGRQNFIASGLGISPDLVVAFREIGTQTELIRELANEMQRVITPDMAKRAEELQGAWVRLEKQAAFLGDMLADKLEPHLKPVLDWMTDLVAKEPVTASLFTVMATQLAVIAGLNFGKIIAFLGMPELTALLALLLAGGEAGRMHVPMLDENGNVIGNWSGSGGPDDPKTSIFQDPWWQRNMPSWLGGHRGAIGQPGIVAPLAPAQQSFLQSLSGPESGGRYDLASIGGRDFALSGLASFPGGPGHFGRYQFDTPTWEEEARRLGLIDFLPASQDRAAWDLAARTYSQQTGRDLLADLQAGGHDQQIAAALQGRWPSVPGGSQSKKPRSGAQYGPPPPPPLPPAKKPAWYHTGHPAAPDPNPGTGVGTKPGPIQVPPPPGPFWNPLTMPWDQIASNNTNIHVSHISVVLPNVTNASEFSEALPSSITTQANRGMIT